MHQIAINLLQSNTDLGYVSGWLTQVRLEWINSKHIKRRNVRESSGSILCFSISCKIKDLKSKPMEPSFFPEAPRIWKSLPIFLEVPEASTAFRPFNNSFEYEDWNGGILDAGGNQSSWRKPSSSAPFSAPDPTRIGQNVKPSHHRKNQQINSWDLARKTAVFHPHIVK